MDRVNPWVSVDDRLPTDEQCRGERSIAIAYWIDDGWTIEEPSFVASHWQPPHMRRPDFWTFADLIAPERPLAATECRCVREDGETRFNINCAIHGKAP